MTYRAAAVADALLLAKMNRQLIVDEGHRNQMTVDQLATRMTDWMTTGGYEAVLFQHDGQTVGYALYRSEPDHIYVRQFFIVTERRRQGLGRAAIHWLRANPWKDAQRLRLDVLVGNAGAIAFWRTVGFNDYCLTLEFEP